MTRLVPRAARAAAAALILLAAAAPARTQPPPRACAGPEHRQFDFWLGTWEVRDREGRTVGVNRIEAILGGCVLQENWTGARGGAGMSFNLYDAATRRWRQTWVDNSGSQLDLAGGLEHGRMVMSGLTAVRPDSQVLNRITWTPRDSARVEQHWESSPDGGRTWREVFWGLYVRRAGNGAK